MQITATTKIELRNISYSARLSQETNAFAADIFIDGRKAGYAENAGHGGPTMVGPQELDSALEAYAKSLPPIVSKYRLSKDSEEPFTYSQSAETIIDGLLADHLTRKDLNRIMGRKVLYLDPAKRALYETSIKGMTPAQIMADPRATERFAGQIILNDMPTDEALRLYRYFG